MNPEQLLEHYDKVADAPDAVARLRRFVLDLAVRGKLVERDPNDEPVVELLKRVSEEKVRLQKSGAIRETKPLPVIAATPFNIPEHWRWSQFAEIGLLSPRNDASDATSASFVPMTRIPAEYGAEHSHEVRPWADIKKGYTHFANGDVGLAKITPCFENGKSAVFENLSGGFGSGTTELHVVRPLFVNARYMLIFLKTPHYIESGIPRMTGTAGQKRVPSDYFAHSAFPLPPVAEQERIVAKVDELMLLCDRLETSRTEREAARDRLAAASLALLNAPDPETFRADARFALSVLPDLTARADQIKQLRQTILNLAVRGKLVEQDPRDEPAGEIVRRISETPLTARKIRRAKNLSSVFADISGPFQIPSGWTWCRFPQLGEFGRGKSKHRPRNDPALFDGGSHRVVQTGDVARSKGLVGTHTSLYNELGLAQSKKWPAGTLCITIAANIADSGILAFDACFPDSVVGFVPDAVFKSARYFEYFIRTVKENLLAFAPATAQKNINLEILESLLIPLPPLKEQERIVERIEELMDLCDNLQIEMHELVELQDRLTSTLLLSAFATTSQYSQSVKLTPVN